MKRFAFITGTARSGTTLTDKIAHAFDSSFFASQPYFGFYVELKKLFFAENPDLATPLPMYHNFPQHPDHASRFRNFLDTRKLSNSEASALTRAAVSAKGQATPAIIGQQLVSSSGSIFGTWSAMHERLGELCKPAPAILGSKEIFCEEFVPWLAANGVRCVLVVRDPRAVHVSINGGRYAARTGDRYPLLLTLRNWRKTAAYCLALQRTKNTFVVRYEDIATDPSEFAQRLADFLDIDSKEVIDLDNLHDQEGRAWQGNSSYSNKRGVENSSINTWRERIEPEALQIIETLAEPEMRALAYPLSGKPVEDVARIMESYQEAPGPVRPGYLESDSMSDANVEKELKRLELLASDALVGPETHRRWFQFETTYLALRTAMRNKVVE